MVSITDTCRPDDEDTVTISRTRITRAAVAPAAPIAGIDQPVTIYYIAWRLKPSHPWRSEEYISRYDAHCEYFARLERGMEVYMEVRRRNAAS
jgi:hypothetical protein